ncbi:type II secretion system F family protein [Microbacterium sp. YY-01]|uniref:type II secretion system F family protein n=1 Tax=Microbacterium sp. YY-01 TaxID=3421634 RepID=UPI003D16A66A
MLAVLLRAGTPAGRAWQHVAEMGDPAARAAAHSVHERADVASALRSQGTAWTQIAAAWEIAHTVGAPLATTLENLAHTLIEAQQARDDIDVAQSEPAATARLMLWLPAVGLLLGMGLGFDTLRIITTHPAGIACAVIGIALMLVARWWTKKLVRKAQPHAGIPGIHAELVAIGLEGGVSIARSVQLVNEQLPQSPDAAATQRVLRLAESAGVPAADLLRSTAQHARRNARKDARLATTRLSSLLLLPQGLCTLPAFLFLGIAPLLISVLDQTPLPFS